MKTLSNMKKWYLAGFIACLLFGGLSGQAPQMIICIFCAGICLGVFLLLLLQDLDKQIDRSKAQPNYNSRNCRKSKI